MLLIERVNEKLTDSSHDELAEITSEPQEKCPRTKVMKCFDEILEESSIGLSLSSSSTSIADQYLAEPNLHYDTGNACIVG